MNFACLSRFHLFVITFLSCKYMCDIQWLCLLEGRESKYYRLNLTVLSCFIFEQIRSVNGRKLTNGIPVAIGYRCLYLLTRPTAIFIALKLLSSPCAVRTRNERR